MVRVVEKFSFQKCFLSILNRKADLFRFIHIFKIFTLPPGPLHPSPPQFISAILRLNVTLGRGGVEMHHGTVVGTLCYYEVAQKTGQSSPTPPPPLPSSTQHIASFLSNLKMGDKPFVGSKTLAF